MSSWTEEQGLLAEVMLIIFEWALEALIQAKPSGLRRRKWGSNSLTYLLISKGFWRLKASQWGGMIQEGIFFEVLQSQQNQYQIEGLIDTIPTSSPNRNLSKNTGRYVKNTNKKSSFFMIPIPKFILKKCLRPIRYFKFKAISLANTWWHGIWIKVKRPIFRWNFL